MGAARRRHGPRRAQALDHAEGARRSRGGYRVDAAIRAPKAEDRHAYRVVLATDRESTLKKEIRQAVEEGFLLCGATLFRQILTFMEKPAEK